MAKISDFIIGLIIVSMFMGVLGIFIAQMTTEYNVEYNESEIQVYNELDNLSALAEDLQAQSNLEGEQNVLDIIGDYFKKGYSAMRLTVSSINTFDTMVEHAAEDANLGASTKIITDSLITIVLIIIIVGIFFAAILKWQV